MLFVNHILIKLGQVSNYYRTTQSGWLNPKRSNKGYKVPIMGLEHLCILESAVGSDLQSCLSMYIDFFF